jgi:hypothetical protein
MTALMEVASSAYRAAEHHAFDAAGKDFLYLVPSGAVFGLSGLSKEIFSLLVREQLTSEELVSAMVARGYDRAEVAATIEDMESCDVILSGEPKEAFPSLPEPDFPLQRIVLNTSKQCNLG